MINNIEKLTINYPLGKQPIYNNNIVPSSSGLYHITDEKITWIDFKNNLSGEFLFCLIDKKIIRYVVSLSSKYKIYKINN